MWKIYMIASLSVFFSLNPFSNNSSYWIIFQWDKTYQAAILHELSTMIQQSLFSVVAAYLDLQILLIGDKNGTEPF